MGPAPSKSGTVYGCLRELEKFPRVLAQSSNQGLLYIKKKKKPEVYQDRPPLVGQAVSTDK